MDSTLLKGLHILELVVQSEKASGVSELASATGLPKSNIHRVLTSLLEAGYLLYDQRSRRYYPSLKLMQLGQRVATSFPLKDALAPIMEALVDSTGESAHLAVRDGDGVVILASWLPAVSLAAVMPENHRLAWADTAFGIALVAALPDGERQMVLKSVATAKGVARLVEDARADGFALKPLHEVRRTFELALPIAGDSGLVLGAIGISGPAHRYDEAKIPSQVEAITAAVRRATQDAGNIFGAYTGGGVRS